MTGSSSRQSDAVDDAACRLTLFTGAIHQALTGICSLGSASLSHNFVVPSCIERTLAVCVLSVCAVFLSIQQDLLGANLWCWMLSKAVKSTSVLHVVHPAL